MWNRILQDVRLAGRSLRKNPALALTAILTLGLGISVNTAVFGAIDAILLHPLPYPHSEELIRIWPSMVARHVPKASASFMVYQEIRRQNHTFQDIAAYHVIDYTLTGGKEPEKLHAVHTTASLFEVLDAKPMVGHPFTREMEQWGRHRVALLSERLWKRSFGSNPDVVGHTITLDDQSFLILGVMPNRVCFPDSTVDLWTPLSYPPLDPMTAPDHFFLDMVGRLKPNVTPEQVRADVAPLMPAISQGLGITLESLKESVVGESRPTLLLLLGAVVLVLLVACTNAANLVLVRATARSKEFSTRAALGAGHGHLIQQMLIESGLLAFFGGCCGLVLAFVFLNVLRNQIAFEIPGLQDASINGEVLLFTLGISVFTCLLCGTPLAWRASRSRPADALRQTSRGAGGGRRSLGRNVLVMCEISMSLALLISAGFLALSLIKLQKVDPGFSTRNVLSLRLDLAKPKYSDPERAQNFIVDVTHRLQEISGTEAAGATSLLPLTDGDWNSLLSVDNQPVPRSIGEVPVVKSVEVTPDYFRSMGIIMRKGRFFTESDRADTSRVAVINEALARRFWAKDDPVGKTLHFGPPEALFHMPPGSIPRLTVVGVVNDIRHNGLDKDIQPTVFIPYMQAGKNTKLSFYITLRNSVPSASSYQSLVADAIHAVDPEVPIADMRSMQERLQKSFARRLFTMWLISCLAASALILALMGIYGFVSYSVGQRTQEVGLRIALGATRGNVILLIMRQSAALAIAGIGLGLVLGYVIAQFAKGLLFGVHPTNPIVYGSTALLLLLVSLFGAYVPARRASRLSPMNALRYE